MIVTKRTLGTNGDSDKLDKKERIKGTTTDIQQ